MSVTNAKSHLWSEWAAVTATPPAAWDGQVRNPAHTQRNFCTAGPTAFENPGYARQIYICSHAHWTLPGFCSFPQALWKSTFLLRT